MRPTRGTTPAPKIHAMTPGKRATIVLIWVVIQLVVFALLFFWCGVAGAYVSWDILPQLFHVGRSTAGVLIGFGVGAIVTVWICHSSRGWLLRLRLRRLRRDGIEAVATVTRLDRRYRRNPRGPGITHYTVHVRWHDPQDGSTRDHERRYRFFGHGSSRFEDTCAHRRTVTVRYDQRNPGRFVIDIPFAPTMADLIC